MSDCGSEWIKVVVELLCYVRSGAVYENARQGHSTVPHPTDGSGAVGSSHHRRDGRRRCRLGNLPGVAGVIACTNWV